MFFYGVYMYIVMCTAFYVISKNNIYHEVFDIIRIILNSLILVIMLSYVDYV